ncbi:MAG: dTDP-4-dehydrorhamnose 3,5-epimerase [Desulfamplus sp.]|nr:dTDP-4-dehydrorhamnose 3,5-epimerase [Desulfamplus sp.]
MHFYETPLLGNYEIELEPFIDDRGMFARTFCKKEFAAIGFNKEIIQINHSLTRQKGTIRGLHYQIPPACETKIIKCIQGRIFDVVVDLRADSATFMKWHSVELSHDNMKMFYIPEGFAHGFQALTDNIELIYYTSEFYNPQYENGLRFDDPSVGIKWPLPLTCISPKDCDHLLLNREFKGLVL